MGSPFKKHRASVASSDVLNFAAFARPSAAAGGANGSAVAGDGANLVGLGVQQQIDEMGKAMAAAADPAAAPEEKEVKMISGEDEEL